jgi:acylphosphatase
MPRDCQRAFFSGHVQGVGFRFTCHSLARGFDITGSVRNLPDGRVEVLAEGEPHELDALLKAIQTEMHSYITSMTIETESPGQEPLTGFSIRF